MDNIEKNNKELIELWKANKRALSMNVLKRFLPEDQMNKLLADYANGLKNKGWGKDRKKTLEQPLTDKDMEVMQAYLFETETPLKELELRFGFKKGYMRDIAKGYMARYLYQNRDICGL